MGETRVHIYQEINEVVVGRNTKVSVALYITLKEIFYRTCQVSVKMLFLSQFISP